MAAADSFDCEASFVIWTSQTASASFSLTITASPAFLTSTTILTRSSSPWFREDEAAPVTVIVLPRRVTMTVGTAATTTTIVMKTYTSRVLRNVRTGVITSDHLLWRE